MNFLLHFIDKLPIPHLYSTAGKVWHKMNRVLFFMIQSDTDLKLGWKEPRTGLERQRTLEK